MGWKLSGHTVALPWSQRLMCEDEQIHSKDSVKWLHYFPGSSQYFGFYKQPLLQKQRRWRSTRGTAFVLSPPQEPIHGALTRPQEKDAERQTSRSVTDLLARQSFRDVNDKRQQEINSGTEERLHNCSDQWQRWHHTLQHSALEEVHFCKQKHPQTVALPLFSPHRISVSSPAGVLMTVPTHLAETATSSWSCWLLDSFFID